jgi:hypothetical protein
MGLGLSPNIFDVDLFEGFAHITTIKFYKTERCISELKGDKMMKEAQKNS